MFYTHRVCYKGCKAIQQHSERKALQLAKVLQHPRKITEDNQQTDDGKTVISQGLARHVSIVPAHHSSPQLLAAISRP